MLHAGVKAYRFNSFFLGALTIVLCVDLVVGRDVGCCKIWTTWRQPESFMSRFVHLINSKKENLRFDRHTSGNSNTNRML